LLARGPARRRVPRIRRCGRRGDPMMRAAVLAPMAGMMLGVALFAAGTWTANAQPKPPTGPTPACSAPSDLNRLHQPLRRLARPIRPWAGRAQRFPAGPPSTSVPAGRPSPSGAGAGWSPPSSPSGFGFELRARFPRLDIHVLNRGVNGEEMPDMLARFEQAVLA